MPVNQGHHVHAKGVLQLGLFVQVVQHHLRYRAALEFDNQAHARFVGLVLNMADVFNLFFVNQLGHALLQGLLVHLVRQLIHNDGLTLAFVNVFKVALGTHHDAATTRAVTVFHATDAVNHTGCRKVRCRNDFHQILDAGFGIAQKVQASVHDFVQVVRRNISRHTNRNTT